MENREGDLFIVIYGEEYEDKQIFSDFEKAKYKLKRQCENGEFYFKPFIEEYTLLEGVYIRKEYEYYVREDDGELEMKRH